LPILTACGNMTSFGAIAQLGERLHGMQEVVGSNPIGSIFHNLLGRKGL
jgi:hypothetical protein